MGSVSKRFPDFLPLEAIENLQRPPDTANLQMFLTVLLCVFKTIFYIKNQDSSIENEDSSAENGDSSLEK